MNKPKSPTLEPPDGFLFEVRITLESGIEYIAYFDSFTEDLEHYNIPNNIQNVYPDAPIFLAINHSLICGVSARVVNGFRILKDDEQPLPPYKIDGEAVPF